MLIDSHAHLDMPEFAKNRKEVIQKAHENGIDYILTIGIDIKSCELSIALAKLHSSWVV